jgi:peptidyl-tRNA hydrolase
MIPKLYVITRADLGVADQAVQSMHALQEYNVEHPERALSWYRESNTLVVMTVANEQELAALVEEAKQLKLSISVFHEPDLNNALTAIAFGQEGSSSRDVRKSEPQTWRSRRCIGLIGLGPHAPVPRRRATMS